MRREQIIKYLKGVHPFMRVAYHASPRARWYYSTIKEWERGLEYNHREVLPHEVIIDLDCDTLEENKKHAKDIASRFTKKGLKYSYWKTNGKGYHFHIFYDSLEGVAEPKLMKTLLVENLLNGVNVKWDRQLCGKHMVRFEGGLYERKIGKGLKKELIKDNGHFKTNPLPKIVWELYKKKVLAEALRWLRPSKIIPGNNQTPECVKYMLSTDFKQHKDGGKRALFILTSWFRKLEDQKLYKILREFNRYNLKVPEEPRQILAGIRSVRGHKGRFVGCPYRHDMLREIGAKLVADKCEKMREAQAVEATNDGSKKEEEGGRT